MSGPFKPQPDVSPEDRAAFIEEIRRLSATGGVWLLEGAVLRLLIPSGSKAPEIDEKPRGDQNEEGR